MVSSSEELLSQLFTKENITLLIALYGAFLTTIKVYMDHNEKKRKIKVGLSFGFLSSGKDVSDTMVILNAKNVGNRPVTLSSMGFILPENKRSIIMDPDSNVSFPHTLNEGKSCIVWKNVILFSQELKRHGFTGKIWMKGYFTSSIDEEFLSKKINFNIK